MGSGGSRTVTEIIYKTDECRPPIRELALEHMSDASRTYDECTRNATSSAWKDLRYQMSEETRQQIRDESKKIKNRLRADRKFCYNIEKKYKPFGIQAPVGLKCDKNEESSKTCRLKNPEDYDDSCESGKLTGEFPSKGSRINQNDQFLY